MTTTENSQTPTSDQNNQQSTQTENQQSEQSQTQQTNSASSTTDLGTDSTESQKSQTTTASSDTTDLGADDEAETQKENPFAEYHGLPESGTYEAFQLPDGAEADPELNESFSGLAKELGLSQKAAQKLVDYKAEVDQKTLQNWVNHKENLRTEAKKDPVIGGVNYTPAVEAGKKSITHFMKADAPAFRAMLNHYGVGAHPLMIRYMAAVGKAMGETATIDPGAGSGVTNKDRPLHEILYEQKDK